MEDYRIPALPNLHTKFNCAELLGMCLRSHLCWTFDLVLGNLFGLMSWSVRASL